MFAIHNVLPLPWSCHLKPSAQLTFPGKRSHSVPTFTNDFPGRRRGGSCAPALPEALRSAQAQQARPLRPGAALRLWGRRQAVPARCVF